MTAYDFTLPALTGGTLDLAQFRGQPLLIANTASRCGFTGQYAGLQALWTAYRERGLVVIGVPSNDFGAQEPGDEAEIGAFCQKNYGVDFPMAAKLHVRGSETHPLFRFLSGTGGALARPRWNFYKYVIDRRGQLTDWFSPITSPSARRMHAAVERMLTSS